MRVFAVIVDSVAETPTKRPRQCQVTFSVNAEGAFRKNKLSNINHNWMTLPSSFQFRYAILNKHDTKPTMQLILSQSIACFLVLMIGWHVPAEGVWIPTHLLSCRSHFECSDFCSHLRVPTTSTLYSLIPRCRFNICQCERR